MASGDDMEAGRTNEADQITLIVGGKNEDGDEFGDEVVFSRAKASLVIDLQAYIRGLLKQDPPKTAEEIAKLVAEWRPGVKARGKTLEEKIAHLFGQLSEEKKAELLSRYMDDVA